VVRRDELQRLLAPGGAAGALLAEQADLPLHNWNGIEVGRLRASSAG
jgi:L-asparaginase II